MTQYIVHRTQEGNDKSDIALYSGEELARYLSKNFESEHYSWFSDTIHSMYRWDNGTLIPVVLCFESQTMNDDYLTSFYSVTKPNSKTPEFEFSVTIDGRA